MTPLRFALALLIPSLACAAPAPAWQAGVATRKLTPAGPIWLAGYANRTAPSNTVDLDVFAKALALDDGAGGRVVIVTLDLVGIPRSVRDAVERDAATRFQLKPEQILLNVSHTHSAPLPYPDRMQLESTFQRAAKPQDVDAVNQFTAALPGLLVELIRTSLDNRAPARLEFVQARAGFAMNRRRPEANGTYSNNPYPPGPVDHDVPVLKVSDDAGKTRAILFGYACHNTVLSGTAISGDYSGHAQQFIESALPGTTALFLLGCGGDQNPYPRRGMVPNRPTEDLVRDHGRALANSVFTALASPARAVRPPLRGAFGDALLRYEPLSTEALAKYRSPEHTPPVIQRAQALMAQQKTGTPPPALKCPVQVLRFGSDLTLVAIGGEVVVDYSLRLKRELAGPAAVWVAGYSNDVFGYLASRRVTEEGGYEGIDANIRILNHPGRFSLETEDTVIAKVHELHRGLAR